MADKKRQTHDTPFLTLQMREASCIATPDVLDHVLDSLDPRFRRVLRPAVEAQAQALGVEKDALSSVESEGFGRSVHLFSELLGTDDGLLGVWIAQPQNARAAEDAEVELFAFAFGMPPIADRLEELVSHLAEAFDTQFEPFYWSSNRFKELKAEGLRSPDPPSEKERAAARILVDPVVKRAALGVASSGGLLVRDIHKQLPDKERHQAENVANALEKVGIVEGDLVVICSKTAGQVLRVPSEEALKDAAAAGVNCACGANINGEPVERALSLTELGRRLLDGSWWMTVLLMEELSRLGVSHSSMLVEQDVDGDEVDCFADISGALVIFELKDKEFSLGNAYSFGSKFGIYRPSYSVVVTTAQVGNDAKEHFKKALSAQQEDRWAPRENQTTIEYVEGLENLRMDLESLVGRIFGGDAEMLVRRVLPAASVTPDAVVQAIAERGSIDDGTLGTFGTQDAPLAAAADSGRRD